MPVSKSGLPTLQGWSGVQELQTSLGESDLILLLLEKWCVSLMAWITASGKRARPQIISLSIFLQGCFINLLSSHSFRYVFMTWKLSDLKATCTTLETSEKNMEWQRKRTLISKNLKNSWGVKWELHNASSRIWVSFRQFLTVMYKILSFLPFSLWISLASHTLQIHSFWKF